MLLRLWGWAPSARSRASITGGAWQWKNKCPWVARAPPQARRASGCKSARRRVSGVVGPSD
eukprot:2296748-Alexandrium_andersonii.AAC.1